MPGTDWPAHHKGKFFFSLRENKLMCGFYIEKGIEDDVDGLCKKYLMGSHWMWHEFIKDLTEGEVEKKLLELQEAKELPLILNIQANLPEERPNSIDPLEVDYDMVEF